MVFPVYLLHNFRVRPLPETLAAFPISLVLAGLLQPGSQAQPLLVLVVHLLRSLVYLVFTQHNYLVRSLPVTRVGLQISQVLAVFILRSFQELLLPVMREDLVMSRV